MRLCSQPFAPRPEPRVPTEAGKSLLGESSDLRKHFFDDRSLNDRTRRGVVALVAGEFSVNGSVREHSTNEWHKVSDALRSLGKLEREKRKPQIRLVQRDLIAQSTIDPSNATPTGYEPWFLERQLQAGDIIIICLRVD